MRRFGFIMLLCLTACDSTEGDVGPPHESSDTGEQSGSGDIVGDDGESGTRQTDPDVSGAGNTESPTEGESDLDPDSGATGSGSAADDSDDSDAVAPDTHSETEDTGPTITCPEGSAMHVSAEGETFCCPERYPVFCDTRDGGYPGGCWSEEVDCATITRCNDDWSACHEGGMPYCDAVEGMTCYPCDDPTRKVESSSGRPFCCTEDHPTFCDENDDGYKGGCWSPAIDCGTVIECDGYWGACLTGLVSSCTDGGDLTCMPES